MHVVCPFLGGRCHVVLVRQWARHAVVSVLVCKTWGVENDCRLNIPNLKSTLHQHDTTSGKFRNWPYMRGHGHNNAIQKYCAKLLSDPVHKATCMKHTLIFRLDLVLIFGISYYICDFQNQNKITNLKHFWFQAFPIRDTQPWHFLWERQFTIIV